MRAAATPAHRLAPHAWSGCRRSRWLLAQLRDHIGLPTVLVLYLLFVIVDAAVGGLAPALVAAVAGFARRQLVLHASDPHLDDRRRRERDRARRLPRHRRASSAASSPSPPAAPRRPHAPAPRPRRSSALASGVVDADPLPTLMSHLRRSFGLSGVALLRRRRRRMDASRPPTEPSVTVPEDADDVHAVGRRARARAVRRRSRRPRIGGCSTRSHPTCRRLWIDGG